MNFGQAIDALKQGKRVRRSGWNGKGMFIWLQKGVMPIRIMEKGDGFKIAPVEKGHRLYGRMTDIVTYEGIEHIHFDVTRADAVKLPCLCMRAASGATLTGWLAAQTDMLAEDWEEVDA